MIELAERRCATCDSADNLQESYGGGGLNDVCLGCFFIWYTGDIPRGDRVRGEDMRDSSLKAKVAGTWPYNGTLLPFPTEAEKERAAASLRSRAAQPLEKSGDDLRKYRGSDASPS